MKKCCFYNQGNTKEWKECINYILCDIFTSLTKMPENNAYANRIGMVKQEVEKNLKPKQLQMYIVEDVN